MTMDRRRYAIELAGLMGRIYVRRIVCRRGWSECEGTEWNFESGRGLVLVSAMISHSHSSQKAKERVQGANAQGRQGQARVRGNRAAKTQLTTRRPRRYIYSR